jgi:hypothetical protein
MDVFRLVAATCVRSPAASAAAWQTLIKTLFVGEVARPCGGSCGAVPRGSSNTTVPLNTLALVCRPVSMLVFNATVVHR